MTIERGLYYQRGEEKDPECSDSNLPTGNRTQKDLRSSSGLRGDFSKSSVPRQISSC